jgi:hypothetical protein
LRYASRFFSLPKAGEVVGGNESEQKKQNQKPDGVGGVRDARRERFAPNRLYADEEKSSAVQCGKRNEVDECEVDRNKRSEEKKSRSAFGARVADKPRDSDRTGQTLYISISRKR